MAPGLIDFVAGDGRDLHADGSEDMGIEAELMFPVESGGVGAVVFGEELKEFSELVLVIGTFSAVIDFLEENDVGILIGDNAGDFLEGGFDVLGRGAIIGSGVIGAFVEENVIFAGHILDVPGHDLEFLTGLEEGGVRRGDNDLGLDGGGMESEEIDESVEDPDNDDNGDQEVSEEFHRLGRVGQ